MKIRVMEKENNKMIEVSKMNKKIEGYFLFLFLF